MSHRAARASHPDERRYERAHADTDEAPRVPPVIGGRPVKSESGPPYSRTTVVRQREAFRGGRSL